MKIVHKQNATNANLTCTTSSEEVKVRKQPFNFCTKKIRLLVDFRFVSRHFGRFVRATLPWVPQDIFFLSILMVRGEAGLARKKITSGHRSTQPHFHVRNQFRILIGYSHVKLFDVANQGHYYIVNSLRTWEYPIGDPCSSNPELISHMEMRLRTPVTRGYFFPR